MLWTVLPALALALPLARDSFEPRQDLRVLALELSSGEPRWEHAPAQLSGAWMELYAGTLRVWDEVARPPQAARLHLDLASGEERPALPEEPGERLARSETFWPPPPVRLANGAELVGFDPGNSRSLRFRRPGTSADAWELDTNGWAHVVRAWGDTVFWAYSYLSEEGVIYAHDFGADSDEPRWTLDLEQLVPDHQPPLHRMRLQVHHELLWVLSEHHLFAVEPASGRVQRHWDFEAELGLHGRDAWHGHNPHFFGGALPLGVLAFGEEVVVVAFEGRVLAIDLPSERILWHLVPDTFPHTPFPLVHGDQVVLIAGPRRTAASPPAPR